MTTVNLDAKTKLVIEEPKKYRELKDASSKGHWANHDPACSNLQVSTSTDY